MVNVSVGGALASHLAQLRQQTLDLRNALRPVREQLPRMNEFYAGRHVFVTGGSGFLGRLLLEMLLRTCPDIGNIYVVLRAKKGVAAKDRLGAFLDVPLFDRLRSEQPNALKKLVALPGDITLPKLGLSEKHQALLKREVSVVFHLAASVRFDDSFQKAVFTNLRSTRDVVDLSRGMDQLKVLVHVSTAYTNINRQPVAEVVYPPDLDWRDVINWAERVVDQDSIDWLGPKVMGWQPNTYTFTKALAEKLIEDVSSELPVVITRPSIVVATLKDPIPGWIDNLYGLSGFWAGGFKGVMRVVYGRNVIFDTIPADIATKQIILASWVKGVGRRLLGEEGAAEVVNVTLGNNAGVSYEDMSWCVSEEGVGRVVPYPGVLRPPKFEAINCRFWFAIMFFYHHFIFACVIDLMTRAAGMKPRLLYIYRKVSVALNALTPFRKEIIFLTHNSQLLQTLVHPADVDNFCFVDLLTCRDDVESFRNLVSDSVRGILKYVLKEEDNPEKNWKHIQRLKWIMPVYHSVMALIFCGILYCLYCFKTSLQPRHGF